MYPERYPVCRMERLGEIKDAVTFQIGCEILSVFVTVHEFYKVKQKYDGESTGQLFQSILFCTIIKNHPGWGGFIGFAVDYAFFLPCSERVLKAVTARMTARTTRTIDQITWK